MTIVEIKELSNGSHRNETILFGTLSSIPDGWAVMPDDMVKENFPFGKIEVAKIDGVMTVTKWVAGKAPAPFPDFEEETETGTGAVEQLRADIDYIAIMTGVEL